MSFQKTVYRDCPCGETAHDAQWDVERKAFVWKCRNCRTFAVGMNGMVREYRMEGK